MTDTADSLHEAPARAFHFDELEVPADALTLDGFRRWYSGREAGGPKVSWIGGRVFVEMTPQSYRSHEPVAHAINRTLDALAEQADLGRYFAAPSWVTDTRTNLSTEPDGFLVRWSSFTSGRVRVNPEREVELIGAPDMALEVVSKTSTRKDQVELRAVYAASGVEEYWLADARREVPSLRILTLRDAAYVDVVPTPDGWLASPLWGRSFRLVSFTNRADLEDARLEQR